MSSYSIGFKVDTDDALSTKGTVITTDGLKSSPFGSFGFNAVLDEEGVDSDHNVVETDYITNAIASYSAEDDWQITSGTYYWMNEIPTRFWCYAPVSINGTRVIDAAVPGSQNLTFSYTLPDGGVVDGSGNKIDADRQDDIVMAYSLKTWKESNHSSHDYDKVNIKFYHALAEVNFIIDLTDGSFASNLDIEDVTLVNVATGGTCNFNGAFNSFTWTPTSTKSDFSQSYTKADLGYREETDADYSADTNSLSAIRKKEMPFMMIPQTLSGALIRVTFSFTPDGYDSPITREREVTIDDTWLAGHYYTYRLKATSISTLYDFSFSVDLWKDGGSEFITPDVI